MDVILLLLACSGGEPEPQATWSPEPKMAPGELLTRASLDLRGVRPTPAELDRIEASPEDYEAMVQDFLYDERFGARVRDLYAEVLLTRSEAYVVGGDSYGISDTAAWEYALGEETLYLLSTVAEEDLPWTEVVTADWTVANETLAAAWPLDYPEGDSGWQKVSYTDGRPMAGVLSTNSFWWRYGTTTSNANRKRANQVSRVFLCNDYLVRPIDFDRNINLLDEEAVADALRNDPSCVNCHNSLDPLAAYFFGYFWFNPDNPAEITDYHPEREKLYEDYLGVSPSYYGQPGYNIGDLGRQIAADNRFLECTVETVYEGLLRRESELADADALTRHREAFLEGDLALRSLVASVVTDPRYQSGDTDAQGYVPRKMATPELLATQIEGLTGFTWTYGGFDMLRTDRYGMRTLAGGADGYEVTSTATSPNTTVLLVQERLAQAAAWHVAYEDATGSAPRLFVEVDFSETPESDREAMVAQIQHLHRAVFGRSVAADGPEVEANLELWGELYALEDDPVEAWAGVLSVLLRDPDLLFY